MSQGGLVGGGVYDMFCIPPVCPNELIIWYQFIWDECSNLLIVNSLPQSTTGYLASGCFMFASLIALFVIIFVCLLGFITSPAFAQEESAAHVVTVSIKWPEAAPQNLRVVILPEGGNCPEVMDGSGEEAMNFAGEYGGLGWCSPANTFTTPQVSEYFTVCTYEFRDSKMYYVLTSIALDISYRESYEYTPVLPVKPAVPAVPKPQPDFEPTSTVLIGTTVFPGWSRLIPLVGFMVVPRSVQLGTSQLALKPVAYGAFLLDNPSVGSAMLAPDLGVGALVGGTVNPDRKIQLHGDAGLMVGYGPAIWGCSSNTVSNPDDLLLTCHSGTDNISLRQQAWWFAPTMALSADIPVGKIRVGLGVTAQLRFVKGYQMLPNLGELEVEAVASDGNSYTVDYRLSDDGWLVTVPIVPTVVLVWP